MTSRYLVVLALLPLRPAPYLDCQPWCNKKYLENKAWLEKYPSSGPILCKKYVACQACNYCQQIKPKETGLNDTKYEVASSGKSCGSEGYRSRESPEACREWCSSHEECLAYVTYENSNCGECVGILHHDCSREFQKETSCSGTITAYNKLSKTTVNSDSGEGEKADASFKCVLGAADLKDVCGSAFETSVASETDTCAESAGKCKQCQGTWCSSVTYWRPESNISSASGSNASSSPLCVMGFSNDADRCHSAYSINGLAKPGTYCAASEYACVNCKGAWCVPGNLTYDQHAATESSGVEDGYGGDDNFTDEEQNADPYDWDFGNFVVYP